MVPTLVGRLQELEWLVVSETHIHRIDNESTIKNRCSIHPCGYVKGVRVVGDEGDRCRDGNTTLGD